MQFPRPRNKAVRGRGRFFEIMTRGAIERDIVLAIEQFDPNRRGIAVSGFLGVVSVQRYICRMRNSVGLPAVILTLIISKIARRSRSLNEARAIGRRFGRLG